MTCRLFVIGRTACIADVWHNVSIGFANGKIVLDCRIGFLSTVSLYLFPIQQAQYRSARILTVPYLLPLFRSHRNGDDVGSKT